MLCLEKLQTIRPRAALGGCLGTKAEPEIPHPQPSSALVSWCFASSRLARGFVASSPSDSTEFRRAGDMPARGFHAAFRLGKWWACHACRDVNLSPTNFVQVLARAAASAFLAAMLQVREVHAAVDLRL